jgi:hypothetical protein
LTLFYLYNSCLSLSSSCCCCWNQVSSPRGRRGTRDSLALETLVRTSRRLTQISLMDRGSSGRLISYPRPYTFAHERGFSVTTCMSTDFFSGPGGSQRAIGTAELNSITVAEVSMSSLTSRDESQAGGGCLSKKTIKTAETSPAGSQVSASPSLSYNNTLAVLSDLSGGGTSGGRLSSPPAATAEPLCLQQVRTAAARIAGSRPCGPHRWVAGGVQEYETRSSESLARRTLKRQTSAV